MLLWYESNNVNISEFHKIAKREKMPSKIMEFMDYAIHNSKPYSVYLRSETDLLEIVVVPKELDNIASIISAAEYIRSSIKGATMRFEFPYEMNLHYYTIKYNIGTNTLSIWKIPVASVSNWDTGWKLTKGGDKKTGIWSPDATNFYYIARNKVFPLSVKSLLISFKETIIMNWMLDWYAQEYNIMKDIKREWDVFRTNISAIPHLPFNKIIKAHNKRELLQMMGLNGKATDNKRPFLYSYYIRCSEKYVPNKYMTYLYQLSNDECDNIIKSYRLKKYTIKGFVNLVLKQRNKANGYSDDHSYNYISNTMDLKREIDFDLPPRIRAKLSYKYEIELQIRKFPAFSGEAEVDISLPIEFKQITTKRQLCKFLRNNKISFNSSMIGEPNAKGFIEKWSKGVLVCAGIQLQDRNFFVVFRKETKSKKIEKMPITIIPDNNLDKRYDSNLKTVKKHIKKLVGVKELEDDLVF